LVAHLRPLSLWPPIKFCMYSCSKCDTLYGNVDFPCGGDGSEIFCRCGEGGLLYCCSLCLNVFCKVSVRFYLNSFAA
jgi:hypothetical protein